MPDSPGGQRPDPAGDPPPAAREAIYRGLFEHSLSEVHVWQVVRNEAGAIVTWRLVDANPVALGLWGRERHEVIGRTADEIFPDGNPTETFMPVVSEIMSTGKPRTWEIEFPGTGQILRMVSFPVGDCFVSTGSDVSDLRRREAEMQTTLRRLEQTVRAGKLGLWDWDLRSDRVRYSDQWKSQLGHGPDEVGDTVEEWRSRVHPDDLEGVMAALQDAIDTRNDDHESLFRMRHKDGSYRWILAQGSFILDEEGDPVRMMGTHVDVTERRRLEERVQEGQKLESLGTLAAGIAHDFNNLLTAIIGNLFMIREIATLSPEARESVREVEGAARRAQGLTTQLLAFAKGGAPIREVTSIRAMIRDSAEFVTRGSPSRCEFSIAPDLANVEVDIDQLSQVVTNLVINADQAMADAGTIRISAANVELERGNELGLDAGPYVRVSVQDDGSGIPSDIQGRIFDPFYTTKADGSGLGLATSYAIVTRHGGRLTLDSEPGRGSAFHIHLPSSTASEQEAGDSLLPVRGSGKLLVMDDDAAVRSVVRRTLEHLGYECDEAIDGDQAVRRYAEALRGGAGYDAVILDLTIRGKPGGLEALRRLQEVDAEVVAIVHSGYSDRDVMANYEAHGFRGRLRKPAEATTLSAEVARVLRGG